jgi:hypothetical protein
MMKRTILTVVPVADGYRGVAVDDVYEGDLHALLEAREAARSAEASRSTADRGVMERLRDAVWPFIR